MSEMSLLITQYQTCARWVGTSEKCQEAVVGSCNKASRRSRPRQQRVAAQSVGVVQQGRRRAGGGRLHFSRITLSDQVTFLAFD